MNKRVMRFLLAVVLSALMMSGALAQGREQQQRMRARQVETAQPAAEATVVLPEQFLNSLLDVMFTKLRAPSFPLSLATNNQTREQDAASGELHHAKVSAAAAEQCSSAIVLEREMGGVRTAVKFVNRKIVAPIAFTGSYNVAMIGCIRFQGWADTDINLEFNRARQTLSARVQVTDIHLNNVPTLANGMVVDLVQSSLDQRINPVEILQAAQLSTRLPIAAAGGALRLRATEVRPEIVDGALRLHIFYEFVRDE